MAERFVPSEPISETDEPNSPIVDKAPEGNAVGEKAFCVYKGKKYTPGSHICHEGWVYTCYVGGMWIKTGPECLNESEHG